RSLSISSSELMRAASFSNLIEAFGAAPPERPFVTMWNDEDNIETVSFGTFGRKAESSAAYFQSEGLLAGETIVLIMPQGIELMAAFLGAMMAGAAPAILAYPNFKVEPEKYRLGLKGVTNNLKARMIVIDEAFPLKLSDYVSFGGRTSVVRAQTNEQEA